MHQLQMPNITLPFSAPPQELSEADAVVCLCGVHGHRFGYALANGIVGMYGGEERYWRIKVSNCLCVHVADVCTGCSQRATL